MAGEIRKGTYCGECPHNLRELSSDNVLCNLEPRFGFRTCGYIPLELRSNNNPDVRIG